MTDAEWSPPNNTVIWRYINWTEYLSLLDTRALWFPNVLRMEDKRELAQPIGQFLDDNYCISNEHRDRTIDHLASLGIHTVGWEGLKGIGITSWHQNAYESAAMWRLYLKSDEGIALKTTIQRLQDSFGDVKPTFGGVGYGSHQTSLLGPEDRAIAPSWVVWHN
ncbi:MAG: hypothetical protein U0836_26575 [Pirellulales bacterium]